MLQTQNGHFNSKKLHLTDSSSWYSYAYFSNVVSDIGRCSLYVVLELSTDMEGISNVCNLFLVP